MIKVLMVSIVVVALAGCAVVRLEGTGFAAGWTCADIQTTEAQASACADHNTQSAPVTH